MEDCASRLSRDPSDVFPEVFATSPATMSMYCQGLNQFSFGTHNNSALINLHLATGQIGRNVVVQGEGSTSQAVSEPPC